MTPDRPFYAVVGGPPNNWRRMVVLDAVTREQIRDVVEANAAEGWIIQAQRDGAGKLVRENGQRVLQRASRPIVICDICRDPDARDPTKPLAPPHAPVAPPRTPEDRQRPSTPEDGQTVTTRQEPTR